MSDEDRVLKALIEQVVLEQAFFNKFCLEKRKDGSWKATVASTEKATVLLSNFTENRAKRINDAIDDLESAIKSGVSRTLVAYDSLQRVTAKPIGVFERFAIQDQLDGHRVVTARFKPYFNVIVKEGFVIVPIYDIRRKLDGRVAAEVMGFSVQPPVVPAIRAAELQLMVDTGMTMEATD